MHTRRDRVVITTTSRNGCNSRSTSLKSVCRCLHSPPPQFTAMRLRLLREVLFLLCLCVVPSSAIGGQTLAIRRSHHQPRRVHDQTTCTYLHVVTVTSLEDLPTDTKDRSLDQIPARKNPRPSKPPLNSKTLVVPQTIAPRKLLRRAAFCRPPASGERFPTDSRKLIIQPIVQ